MLRYSLTLLLISIFAITAMARPFENPPVKGSDKLYEVRIYYPTPGKYNEIVDRFRQYTTKLFEKHGMENIGYWTPTDTARHELIYILAYPNRAARDSSWKHFGADPDWKAVVAKTEANGKLVARVDQIFMTETDFSPLVQPHKDKQPRTFEMRTYTAEPGKLPDLLARFRNHTVKLIDKHKMNNIGYWLTEKTDANGQAQLFYILAHPSEAIGKEQWEAFRNDPAWKTVKETSEKNGPITKKIDAVYLHPTDYSPMR
jgi:hypothetical protein